LAALCNQSTINIPTSNQHTEGKQTYHLWWGKW